MLLLQEAAACAVIIWHIFVQWFIQTRHFLSTLCFAGNITLLVDGIDGNFNSLNNQTKRLNGSVVISRPKENEFKATYRSGISVTLTKSKGALSILMALPRSFKNQTKGLLGTWNGNKLDDFTTPSGYVVPTNSTSRQIHFDFGQKCKYIG